MFEGHVDHCDPLRVIGWAYDTERSDATVGVELWHDGEMIVRGLADLPREDLRLAGKGDGRHGFEIDWPKDRRPPVGSRPIIRFAGVDQELLGSPNGSGQDIALPMPVFSELSEKIDEANLPPADQISTVSDAALTRQRLWRKQGYLWLENFLPDDLLDRYSEARWRLRPSLKSWRCPVPYLYVPEMRDLALHKPLTDILDELIGTRMALNLALTGWRSTQRAWHQDDYLNPPTVNCRYLAVWIALDDIPADCGPFEFVQDSHHWPLLRRDRILDNLPDALRSRPSWPVTSEYFVEAACRDEIIRREASTTPFLAKKGDVLIWHAALMHRGGAPARPGAVRKSLITHYTAADRGAGAGWPMPVQHGDGGWYFPLEGHPLDDLAAEDRSEGPMP